MAARLPVDPAVIPAELREAPCWVTWRLLLRKSKNGEKLTKVPFQARLVVEDGKARRMPAESTNPATWATFDEAWAAASDPANRLDGVGFVFAPDGPYAGVDFDNCLDESGAVLDWARPFLDRLVGYAEISPSGRGVKVFCRGEVPDGKGRKLQNLGDGTGVIEAYAQGRYFTVTGRLFDPAHAAVGDGAVELARLHRECWPPKVKAAKKARKAKAGGSTDADPHPVEGDEDLIARARAALNGPKFSALFDGSTEGYRSKSEADLALCSLLAFWVGNDEAAIDRLFRRSQLADAKWTDRADYREMTIAKALERSDFYKPKQVEGEGEGEDGPNESAADPHRLARVFIKAHCTHPDGLTMAFHRGEYHRWSGSYRTVSEKEVRAELNRELKVEFDRLNVRELARHRRMKSEDLPPQVRKVTASLTNNVNLALSSYALIKSEIEAPEWLVEVGPWPAREILPVRNGLVHLPSFVAGKPCLIDPTPAFFCPYATDYDFDPRAFAPVKWLGFLDELWPNDPESIATLQEWFGYHLTPDTKLQKIGMLIGPRRSGKGTITRIQTALVGKMNVCNPTLSSLGTPFGCAILIGKLAAIITDARLSGRTDIAQVVENLLAISGEDSRSIARKHLADWTGQLMAKFTIVSNETPRLADSSGALAGRMIILHLTRSFYGQEDSKLIEKLLPELPGILLWAIEGWRRLNERGHFVQPDSALSLVQEMEELSSPIGLFVKDRCDIRPGLEIATDRLFDAWKAWCVEMNRDAVGDLQSFGRNLRTVMPELKTPQRKRSGIPYRVFQGIDLMNFPAF